jgi:hypothetical protein
MKMVANYTGSTTDKDFASQVTAKSIKDDY